LRPRNRGGRRMQGTRGGALVKAVDLLEMRYRVGRARRGTLDAVALHTFYYAFGHRLAREAVLCTDGAPVYQRYAQQRGVVREPVNLAQGIRIRRPAFHVQNVNAYHSRWTVWMDRFLEVSPRYLNIYLGWYRMLAANRRKN